jgi:predicted Zn-dependent protease
LSLDITFRAETISLRTINSNGLDAGFGRPLYVVNATAVTERKGQQYTATYNRTAPGLASFSAEEFCRNLIELLEYQYDPQPFWLGSYPVILRNNVAYKIFSTAWQIMSGQRYIEGSSMLAGRLGEPVAAECLSIRDYPARPDSGFDLPCDCEGSPGKPVDLLERGVFKGLMHNLSTAKALGAEPAGNAGRRPLLSGSIPTEIQVTPETFASNPALQSSGDD